MNERMNELMNDEAVYRTAPATPGLLKSPKVLTMTKLIYAFTLFDLFAYGYVLRSCVIFFVLRGCVTFFWTQVVA